MRHLAANYSYFCYEIKTIVRPTSKNALTFYRLVAIAAIGIILLVAAVAAGLIPGVNVPWGQLLGARTDKTTVERELQLAPGYRLDLYSEEIPNARFLAVTRNGDLLVSQPKLGRVSLLLADRNGDGKADGQRVLIDGLQRPHGLALHEDWLYIAESNGVGRALFDHSDGRIASRYQRIVTDLGDGGNHWTKTIGMGPDGWMYLSSGSTCNVCEEEDPRRATIMRFRPDGSHFEIYATGLRNSVGFDWSPKDGALYATDNGRDWLGNDFPPCELNRIEQDGFYGWPYANGNRVPDPDFGEGKNPEVQQKIAASIPPAFEFRAHNAPLGMRFLRSSEQPDAYRDVALVALHGSWNRDVKDGYKVVALHWDERGKIHAEDFMWGFLADDKNTVYGRPVDIVEDARGNIYVSDDYAGAVYRIQPGAANSNAPRVPAGTRPPISAPKKPLAIDGDAARQGAQIFERRNCIRCHQQIPLQNLSRKYTLKELADYFDTPTPPMPNYGFSNTQKRALAHYLMEQEIQGGGRELQNYLP
ncbi:PQQ-dependent sugar dehydrogenase [Microbulbifer pacificus]|uniref:PQQ-dependent sugar dehydrogenase n=1 Tax=Microbulbifer pacificus TaxID=407164 RepID=A0AAU0MXT3_9GAMM|nr:PQQ-dependent sugar dehydrogenase [Microbulbifer pacificus]WOX04565.1 PQQ-dependent sugar dehydrogenase [Microbulbifer pacificus]